MRIMARVSASKAKARGISRGSGNAFADLSFPDAEERQTKIRLAYALNTILDEQHLAQAAAAARLGLNQPKGLGAAQIQARGFLGGAADDVAQRAGSGRRNRHSRQAAFARGGADQRGGGVG
jgi:predicted XRE-type DNA-binding protein